MKSVSGLSPYIYTEILEKSFFFVKKGPLVCPTGFEPVTYGLEIRCSIQLSYGHFQKKRNILIGNENSSIKDDQFKFVKIFLKAWKRFLMGSLRLRGRVYRSSQKEFYCKAISSGEMLKAKAFGKLLKRDSIVVGDYVQLEKKKAEEVYITSVFKRETEIFRILIRENKKKITAANVNCLVIVLSVSRPSFKRGIVDRFLVRAHQWKIKPLLVFNKMDEGPSKNLSLNEEKERLSPLDIDCFEVSAKQGDHYLKSTLAKGLHELKRALEGKTALLMGQSGVGKSTLINSLSGEKVSLKTQKIGKAGKGPHTTTWSEIIECPPFFFLDSPGIRSFSLQDIRPDELLKYFPDLEKFTSLCQFPRCTHNLQTKGCIFFHNDWPPKKRNHIWGRLESYHKILDEISQTPVWAKKF